VREPEALLHAREEVPALIGQLCRLDVVAVLNQADGRALWDR
jgi:hypothetical protein